MLMRDCRPLHPSKEAISKALTICLTIKMINAIHNFMEETIGNSMNIIGNIGMLNFNQKKKAHKQHINWRIVINFFYGGNKELQSLAASDIH